MSVVAEITYNGEVGTYFGAVQTRLENLARTKGGYPANFSYRNAGRAGVFQTLCEFPAQGSRDDFVQDASNLIEQIGDGEYRGRDMNFRVIGVGAKSAPAVI
jgi:hypothetical protein